MRQPGPIKAFYERVRARRGHRIAIVAAARKLARRSFHILRELGPAALEPLPTT